MLIGTPHGVFRIAQGKTEPYRIQGGAALSNYRLFRDRDGGLWIGTSGQGLVHVHNGRTDVFTRVNGLSSDEVTTLFEDREGDIWVATYEGLDRLRELPVVNVSKKQGLATDAVWSVLADKDGGVWLSGRNGLDRLKDGKVTNFRKSDGLPDDSTLSVFQDDSGRIWAFTTKGLAQFDGRRFTPVREAPGREAVFAGYSDHIWLSHGRGLSHLLDGHLVEEFSWPRLRRAAMAYAIAADPQGGGLWLGFYIGGGVDYFKGGQIRRSYNSADGLGAGGVTYVRLDPDGRLWAATQGGLSVIQEGRVATLTGKNGLPCDTVHWATEDDDNSTWLYMACGLVRINPAELYAWIANPKRMVQVAVFDGSDGVRLHSRPFSSYTAPVGKSTDGKLWFTAGDGVSVIDPRHLPVNKIPPPVHIESIKADGKSYDVKRGTRLPALVRDVTIDYTALSLVAPEKVHFKYKLEGQDRDWKEVINDREAQYTNLPPRNYRFRVMASQQQRRVERDRRLAGVFHRPAYYQTNWFRASLVAAFFLVLWALYRLRLHQLAREFNAQLEGRVDERLRVARDLHDTLLQSFQGLVPVFQTARNLLPGQSDRAVEVVDEGLHDAADAIVEGRSAIQNLRAQPSLDPDLGTLLNAAGQELAQSPEAEGSAPAFRVVVEGSRLPLVPLLRDEIYRIGREVLRNAFRHAHAGRIEAEIRYDRDMFRLRIRDDGKGIDSSVLKEGARTGHFGLPGMHERAKKIGARLKIWSEPGAGTEAELTVPARIAYEKFSRSNGWWARFGRRLRMTAPQQKRESGSAPKLDESRQYDLRRDCRLRGPTTRGKWRKMRMGRSIAVGSIALVLGLGPATALDPHTRITQYFHTAWRVQDGAFEAAPNAVTQTADGYIWIGTGSGLVKYDGARFDPWAPPPGKSLANPNVISLLGSSDGTLWIGTAGGLLSWKNNDLREHLKHRINGIIEDHKAGIWVAQARTRDAGRSLPSDGRAPRLLWRRRPDEASERRNAGRGCPRQPLGWQPESTAALA